MTEALLMAETVQSGTDATAARTIGAALERARIGRQLELADAAKALHLQRRQVSSLEAGDFSTFNNPVFVKGHLRAYAKLVGIDGDMLVRQYETIALPLKSSVPAAAPVLTATARLVRQKPAGRRWHVLLLLLVAMLLFAGWKLGYRSQLPADLVRQISLSQLQRVSTVVDPDQQQATAPADAVADAPVAVVPAAAVDATVPEPVLPAQVVASAEVPAQPVAATESPAGVAAPEQLLGSVLHLEFSDDCWVQIKDAQDKVLHEQVHRSGEVFELTAPAPLQLWFGKGGAVNMSYNGTDVEVPVKAGYQSARFVLEDEPPGADAEE